MFAFRVGLRLFFENFQSGLQTFYLKRENYEVGLGTLHNTNDTYKIQQTFKCDV